MRNSIASSIEQAILNLKNRRPKPRDRREELAPYVDQLRSLLAQGWTRSEILGEIKALGVTLSAATLRDVLGLEVGKAKKAKPSKRRIVSAPAQTTEPPTASLPAIAYFQTADDAGY